MVTLKKFLLLNVIALNAMVCYSQDIEVIDSLKQVHATATTELESIGVSIALGEQYVMHNPDSALIYFVEAKEKSGEERLGEYFLTSTNYIGVAHHYKGNYEEAMAYYIKAATLADSLGEKRKQGIILNNIGAIEFELDNMEQAEHYYKQAKDLFVETQDSVWLGNILSNLANILEKQNKLDQALSVYKQAIELAKHTGNKEAFGAATSNMGNVYSSNNDYSEALKSYMAGLKVQEEIGDGVGQVVSLNNIGQILSKTGEHEKALEKHTQALLKAKGMRSKENQKDTYRRLSEAYERAGNFEKALQYQTKHIHLKDSLDSIEKSRIVQSLRAAYENERKEREIESLAAAQVLSDERARRAENTRNAIIFIAMLLSGGLFIVYRNYQERSKLSSRLQESLNEKEVLMREIHHRVKNNLQIISSLLNIQSRQEKSETAISALKESKNRVQSMAIIHQKLYQKNNVTTVRVRGFISQLVEELLVSFGKEDHIEVYMDIEDLDLNVDTTIPLGLIINELVTNAVKYAFNDVEEPELSISLNKENELLTLKICDNGNGLGENVSESFGMNMVKMLAKKLHANLKIEDKHGVCIQLDIKYDEKEI